MKFRYSQLEGLLKEGFVIFIKRGSDKYKISIALCEEIYFDDNTNKGQFGVHKEVGANKVYTALGGLEHSFNTSKELQIPEKIGFIDTLVSQGGIFGIVYDKRKDEKDPSFKVFINSMKAPTYTISSDLPLCATIDKINDDEEIRAFYKSHGYKV